jgi:hypothetical protein
MDTFDRRIREDTIDRAFFALDTNTGIQLPDHLLGRRLTEQDPGKASNGQTGSCVQAFPYKIPPFYRAFLSVLCHFKFLLSDLFFRSWRAKDSGQRLIFEQLLQGKSMKHETSVPEFARPLQPRNSPENTKPPNKTARIPSLIKSRLLLTSV